jgi:hypothetical protein
MPVFGSKQRCWVVHASVGFETSVLVVHTGAQLKTSVLGCICRQFCVGPYPSTMTRGGGEGAAHRRCCPGWHFGQFGIQGGFMVFDIHSCLLAVDRWWVPTALGGVSTPFSQRSLTWVTW